MYLNINSTFQPYNYAELVAPFVAYKQAYEAAEKEMSTLSQQTAMWQNIAEKDRSPRAYQMYNNYSNKLNEAADNLSRGLTATNRASLMDLKRGYASEITPIVNAYNRRAKLTDALAEAKLKNPYIETEYDPESMSLDTFIDNPNQSWGQSLNGAIVAQQVDAAAKNLAREANTPEGQERLKALLPYTYEMTKTTGFKSDDILRAIRQDPNAPKVLQQIVSDAVKGTGVYDWQGLKDDNGNITQRGQAIINRLTNIGSNSLWSAIGEEKSQIVQDSYSQQVALEALKQQYAMQQLAAQNQGAEGGYNPGLNIASDEMDLGATEELQEARKKQREALNTLGFSDDMNSNKYREHINVTKVIKSSDPEKTDIVNLTPRLWGKTGTYGTTGYLLSEKQFVAQGKNEIEKQVLRDYYKQNIIPAYTQLTGKNAWGSSGNHASRVLNSRQALGNSRVTVPRMNFSDNAKVLTDRVGSFINNSQIQEITGADKEGNITLKRSGISQDEWTEIKKDIKDSKIAASDIQYHVLVGDSKGNNGVVVTITRDGKSKNYLIRDSYLTRRSIEQFKEINAIAEKQIAEARKQGASAEEIQAIKNNIASASLSNVIRDLSWDVAGSYTAPTQSLQQSPSVSNQ